VRTTLDLPDPIFRDLKSRAAQQGLKLKELLQQYVVEGLRRGNTDEVVAPVRSPLPNLRPTMHVKIPSLTNAELNAILDEEEIERHEKLFRH
jgi:hypothetical protein